MSSLSQSALSLPRAAAAPSVVQMLRLSLARWSLERRTRIELARLDAHLLEDIGLAPRLGRVPATRPLPRIFPGF